MERKAFTLIGILLFPFLSLAPSSPPFSLTIFYSGENRGYLEPCGCVEHQLGGFSRRGSLLRTLKDPNRVLVENGDLSSDFGRQDELKYETAIQAMNEMEYTAFNIGEGDLRMGTLTLMAMSQIARFPFLSANLTLKEGTPYFTPFTIHTISLNGREWKMGITGILGKEFREDVSEEYIYQDPDTALVSILEELERDSDLILLLAHTGREEARRLARSFPSIRFIVTGHGDYEPSEEPERIGETFLLNSGMRGQYIGKMTLILKEEKGILGEEHEMIALTDGIRESSFIRSLLTDYQKRVELEDLLHQFLKKPYPSGGTYEGSEACKWCHKEAYEIWQKTAHAKRTHPSIVEAGHPVDPECVICHSTAFRYTGGFVSMEETPHLAPMGCENCHGPRSVHIKNPKRRVGEKPTEAICKTCHDPENSPQFEFESYWEKIKH